MLSDKLELEFGSVWRCRAYACAWREGKGGKEKKRRIAREQGRERKKSKQANRK
jgi:hypothetical protein